MGSNPHPVGFTVTLRGAVPRLALSFFKYLKYYDVHVRRVGAVNLAAVLTQLRPARPVALQTYCTYLTK